MRKALVPVDGSAAAHRAVRHIVALAGFYPSLEAVLLNVQPPIDAPEVLGHMPQREIEAMQETRGGDALASARAQLDAAGVSHEPMVVLGPVAEGRSNAQIADALAVSGKTVANYVPALLSSLLVRDWTHLAELVNTRRPSPPRASRTSGDART